MGLEHGANLVDIADKRIVAERAANLVAADVHFCAVAVFLEKGCVSFDQCERHFFGIIICYIQSTVALIGVIRIEPGI